MSGSVACTCCGMDISGVPGDKCDWCRNGDGDGAGEGCDMTRAWHCFTAHCDGTGCTYPGECQEKDDTFRDYHVGGRVRISEDWGGSSPHDSSTVEGVLESGEIAVRIDGLPAVWNISPIFLTPILEIAMNAEQAFMLYEQLERGDKGISLVLKDGREVIIIEPVVEEDE